MKKIGFVVLAVLLSAACQREPASGSAAASPNGIYSIGLTSPSVGGLPKCTSTLAGTTAYVQSPSGLWSCISGA